MKTVAPWSKYRTTSLLCVSVTRAYGLDSVNFVMIWRGPSQGTAIRVKSVRPSAYGTVGVLSGERRLAVPLPASDVCHGNGLNRLLFEMRLTAFQLQLLFDAIPRYRTDRGNGGRIHMAVQSGVAPGKRRRDVPAL